MRKRIVCKRNGIGKAQNAHISQKTFVPVFAVALRSSLLLLDLDGLVAYLAGGLGECQCCGIKIRSMACEMPENGMN